MFNSKNPRISADILHLNAIFWFYNPQPSAYPDFFILLSIGKLCTHLKWLWNPQPHPSNSYRGEERFELELICNLLCLFQPFVSSSKAFRAYVQEFSSHYHIDPVHKNHIPKQIKNTSKCLSIRYNWNFVEACFNKWGLNKMYLESNA